MREKISGLILFAAAAAVFVVLIKVADWLPEAMQEGTIRKYGSIEEVERKLNIKDIFVPSYFPQGYIWPPSVILAQGKPFRAVVMEFKDKASGATALLISQSDSKSFVPDEKIKIVELKEKAAYDLKGRDAVLETGACKNNEPCSRISWNEGDCRIYVVMRATPFELIRIANSMLH
jgi:hypothetical protein